MNINFDKITIDSPEAFVAAVPYLIGFHPHQAVVVCAFKHGKVLFTAHLEAVRLDTVLDDTCAKVRHHQAEDCAVVGYDADGDTTALDRACHAITATGVPILDAIIATETTWRSLACDDSLCCPAEGKPLPDATHPVAVAMIAAGQVAVPDRRALRQQLAPVDSQACQAVAEHMDGLLQDHAALSKAVTEADRLLRLYAQQRGDSTDTRSCAILALAAWHPGFFTTALRIGVGHPHASQDTWAWVCRHVTGRRQAAALVLCAWAAHQTGHGSLASEALLQALKQAPNWPTARRIAVIIDSSSPGEAADRIASLP